MSSIEAVLDEVAAGRIERHLTGRGLVEESVRTRRVEAPYLQLVLRAPLGGRARARLGRAARVDAGRTRWCRADRRGASRAGTRGPGRSAARSRRAPVQPSRHPVRDEDRACRRRPRALRGRADPARLEPVLGDLDASRILRRVPGRCGWAAALRDLPRRACTRRPRMGERRRLEAERAKARRRHRRLAPLAVLALVALAGTLALAAWALAQRSEARDSLRVRLRHAN